jgi:NADP-dependent 3-hydroxy acid dehydrogenase YdfG
VTGAPQLGRRTALVTGASRGIGLEVARVLAADGMRVAMLARSEDALRRAADAIGSHAVAVPCDVGDAAAVERAAAMVRDSFAGAPDVIVNCAGVFQLAPIEQTAIETFRRSLDVNLVAPFLIVRAFLADMRARATGHVVTIGSIADRVVFPENAAYAASKFGARAMHETLRMELRGSGVRASLVSPGPVDTALWDDIDPDTRPGFTPRREMLPASAVASAVRYVVVQPAAVNVDELRLSHS